MSTLAQRLAAAVEREVRFIGQIRISPGPEGFPYQLCHLEDSVQLSGLAIHEGPSAARDLSTWAEDGHYRFTKGELSLRRGWLMRLRSAEELLSALDAFYPAAAGVWFARQDGRLTVEHLRSKLDRQTGMYRGARNLSDAGAQRLVQEVCGPGHCCVKKILWQIDGNAPLEESPASRFPGFVEPATDENSIPLLCREACNHFVAEARKAAKEESRQTA